MSLFLDRNRIYPVPTELTIFGNNNFHTGTTKYNTMEKKRGSRNKHPELISPPNFSPLCIFFSSCFWKKKALTFHPTPFLLCHSLNTLIFFRHPHKLFTLTHETINTTWHQKPYLLWPLCLCRACTSLKLPAAHIPWTGL